jgi:hypothetical protein
VSFVGRLTFVPAAAFALLWAMPAAAATVILVQPANPAPGMTEAVSRIHGELMSAGFDLQIVDASAVEGAEGQSRGGLERLAVRRGADAVIAMIGSEGLDSVEVWVIDKVTGKSVVRRVPFQAQSARGPETLAVRAIELLRASFLEIDLSSRIPPSEPKPSPPAAVVHFVGMERKAERPERVGLALGGLVMTSLDGVGPAYMPVARIDWAVRPWLVAQMTVAGWGTRPSVQAQTASAKVAQEFLALGASYKFRADRQLRPFVSLSSGLLHTSADGQAEAPDRSLHPQRWSFLLDGGVGVELALPERWHVSLAAHAQIAEPYPAIRIVDSVVATSGRPNLLLTLTVGAWL